MGMTVRTLTPAVDSALAAGHVAMLVFVLMDFPGGILRVNNSAVSITWDGYDWLGVGRLGSIGSIDEGATLESRGLSLAISGVPPENIALALGQSYQGRDCKV
jgi:hypothetical protein